MIGALWDCGMFGLRIIVGLALLLAGLKQSTESWMDLTTQWEHLEVKRRSCAVCGLLMNKLVSVRETQEYNVKRTVRLKS